MTTTELEMLANANQRIANLERANSASTALIDKQARIIDKQARIIDDCLAQIPVGNIEMHTPEKLADKICYFVRSYAEGLDKIEKQSRIIAACMAEVPVGNITTHTPENLAERIGWYITQFCELSNAEDRLIDMVGGGDIEAVIANVSDLLADYEAYKGALTIISRGTEHSKELANRTLGWSGSEHYQVELLREDNLRLRLELEDLQYNVIKKVCGDLQA